MANGLISVGGRTFQYEYISDVTDAAAKSKADILKKSWSWMQDAQLLEIARNMIIAENRKQASVRAKKGADAIMQLYRDAKLEIGIAQRLEHDVDYYKIYEIAAEYGMVEVGYTEPKDTIKDAAEVVHEALTPSIQLKAAERTGNKVLPLNVYREVPSRLIDAINKKMDEDNDPPTHPERVWIRDVRLSQPNKNKPPHEQFHDIAIQMSGGGMPDSSFAQEMYALNRFNKTFVGPNRELQGWTFITRPHLNLSAENISRLGKLQHLLYAERNSIPYAVRMWMDPVLQRAYGTSPARMSPLVDYYSPFFTPLCNRLISCNGWPDLNVGTETSEGGFFSENQTVAIGGDRMARGYDFTLSWKELQGGIIASIIDTWCLYMTYIGDGTLHQRVKHIEGNVMGYTVSIYRFLTDHTGRRVTRYAKATGCFPKLAPTGTPFNVNQNEWVVTAGNEVSVNFQVHKVDYNDPRILQEFNKLVSRYLESSPVEWNGSQAVYKKGIFEMGNKLSNNFEGHPWITQRNERTELVWLNTEKIASGRTIAAT